MTAPSLARGSPPRLGPAGSAVRRPSSSAPVPAARGRARLRSALLATALVLTACASGDAPADDPGAPTQGTGDGGGGAAPAAPDATAAEVDGRARSPFTGLPQDADVLARPALIVKIENSPRARPQTGLDAADVVIEELVEGGITRFVAVFHATLPESAGPVRSARPVDVDLLGGFGASGFAYSGARAEVEELLATVPSVRVTEGAPGFFRATGRDAPHNLYLRTAETLEAVVARGARPLRDLGWVFDADVPADALSCPTDATACGDPGASVTVVMSPSFRTGWTYDERAGLYRRDQNGEPSEVTGGGRIGAANVVILATRHYVGISGYDETDATTDGAPALVLRDGRRYAATWRKPTASDPLLLLTPEGDPFPLRPGPTWLHLPRADRMPTVGG